MHITILAIGSRGDVQPLVALGKGLIDSGYGVRLATHKNFEGMVLQHGLEFSVITGDPQDFFQTEMSQALMRTRNPIVFNRLVHEALDPAFEKIQIDSWKACQGTNAIIACGLSLWGIDIAEKLSIPCFYSLLQPASPTTDYPYCIFPPASKHFGGLFNYLSYLFFYDLISRLFRNPINSFRQSILDLPPNRKSFLSLIRARKIPLLNAVSPSVISPSADWTELDYMTGYWFLKQASEYKPPPDLQKFLRGGPPPVYVGFGSMGGAESHRTVETALAALAQIRQRGVIFTGWSNPDCSNLPDNIFRISSIPHDWLFPQMSCIVHHGGAGTTATAFQAGVPNVIIPFLADQPFWGDLAYKLGVSPAPLNRKKLTATNLAETISLAINDSTMKEKAAELSKAIHSEDGIRYTINIIEQTLASSDSNLHLS